MNPAEYAKMAEAEGIHWWYRGLSDVIDKTLRQPRFGLPRKPRVLDAGCGTGGNLRLLRGLLSPSYLGGFDLAPEAVAFAQAADPLADVYVSDLCRPELHVDELDLVISCDVLCIPGAQAALVGLQRIANALKSGGLLLLHLPAYNWLFSQHDVAVHTSERYTVGGVRRLLAQLGLAVDLVSYRVCALFPLVLLARLPSILAPKPSRETARSDVVLPSRPVNAVLKGIVTAENSLIRLGARLPFGSSVLAVGRKP